MTSHLILVPGLVCDEAVWEHQAKALSILTTITIADHASIDSLPEMAEKILAEAPPRFALAGHSFEDLEVFRRAYQVSLEMHKESLGFPQIEQFAMADQIRRASKSICANIAEGFAKQRRSSAEYRRYLLMAIGSADEMRVLDPILPGPELH